MENNIVRKILCFVPGVGVPASAYYALISKDKSMNTVGRFGFVVFGAAVAMMVPGMINFAFLMAGFYIYLGIVALAASWGFLAMLLIWRAVTGRKFEWVVQAKVEEPAKSEV